MLLPLKVVMVSFQVFEIIFLLPHRSQGSLKYGVGDAIIFFAISFWWIIVPQNRDMYNAQEVVSGSNLLGLLFPCITL